MCPKIIKKVLGDETVLVLAANMFKDEIIQTVILPVETPADQVEQLRQQRREAKAEYDSSWKTLQEFLHANPPTRRPSS